MLALVLAAALVSTTDGQPAQARPSYGYGVLSVGYQIPTGSYYDGDFGTGIALHGVVGARPVSYAAIEADFLYAHGGVRRSTPDAEFQSYGIAVRGFAPISPKIEGTIALGYSPEFATRVGELGLFGYSTDVSAGIRTGRGPNWRFVADARYSFVRFTRGHITGASGGLGRQRHGDIVAFVLGTMLRF